MVKVIRKSEGGHELIFHLLNLYETKGTSKR